MKKTWYAAAALCVLLMCASCGNILLRDPRLYNTSDTQQKASLPAPDISEAQQRLFADCEKNKDKLFPAANFDSWLLKVSFDKDNVPEYRFFEPEDSRKWQLTQSKTSEYQFNASNDGNKSTTILDDNVLDVPINPMRVFQYRGMNPLVSTKSGYNKLPEMERFYFYRFTGNAGVSLDNYLAAVDTYSKFLFVYGKIDADTAKELLGKYIPEDYDAVELFDEGNGKRPFYEYDPIGYVASDGTVRLYQEYRDAMTEGDRGAVDFFPYIKAEGAREVARHEEGGAGRSPYLVP